MKTARSPFLSKRFLKTTSLVTVIAVHVLAVTLGLTVAGCYGRPHLHSNETDRLSAYGLTENKPAVVVFSALWCHPCRQEIHNINLAEKEFGSQIQFLGLLVEGEEKGSTVTASDQGNFTTFSGEAPAYTTSLDPNWRQFDALNPPEGRSLPTLVLIGPDGHVQQIIQESLDYETDLRPLLQELVAESSSGYSPIPTGKATPTPTPTPPPPSTGPTPTPIVWQNLTLPLDQWEQRSEVRSQTALLGQVSNSWSAGLSKYAFTTAEMPLASGTMNFQWDGNHLDQPISANWRAETADSICTMSVVFNPDGTTKSSSGHCRPK